jgi:hypothetical protein
MGGFMSLLGGSQRHGGGVHNEKGVFEEYNWKKLCILVSAM